MCGVSEVVENVLPASVDPAMQGCDARRVHGIDSPVPGRGSHHESGTDQGFQMLGHRGPADRERLSDVDNGRWPALDEAFVDGPAGRVGERRELACPFHDTSMGKNPLTVSVHLPLVKGLEGCRSRTAGQLPSAEQADQFTRAGPQRWSRAARTRAREQGGALRRHEDAERVPCGISVYP